MDVILVPLSLFLVGWAIRSICIKKTAYSIKVGKIFICWNIFHSAGRMFAEGNKVLAGIVMMAVGAAVVWYSNRNYVEPPKNNDEVLREHTGALKEFHLSSQNTNLSIYRSTNYAKGKEAELKTVAFYYGNSNDESSFRDVDVKNSMVST